MGYAQSRLEGAPTWDSVREEEGGGGNLGENHFHSSRLPTET